MSGKNSVMLYFFFRHNFNKSLRKIIFLVSLHSRTSPLVFESTQLKLYPSPTTSAVDDFQRLRFGNSQSPNKFTGKPKIVSHPKSSQERLKYKSMFTFTLRNIYPSTISMACHIVTVWGGQLFKTEGKKRLQKIYSEKIVDQLSSEMIGGIAISSPP